MLAGLAQAALRVRSDQSVALLLTPFLLLLEELANHIGLSFSTAISSRGRTRRFTSDGAGCDMRRTTKLRRAVIT